MSLRNSNVTAPKPSTGGSNAGAALAVAGGVTLLGGLVAAFAGSKKTTGLKGPAARPCKCGR